MAGYTGKIALVDLTSGSITKEPLPEEVYRNCYDKSQYPYKLPIFSYLVF